MDDKEVIASLLKCVCSTVERNAFWHTIDGSRFWNHDYALECKACGCMSVIPHGANQLPTDCENHTKDCAIGQLLK